MITSVLGVPYRTNLHRLPEHIGDIPVVDNYQQPEYPLIDYKTISLWFALHIQEHLWILGVLGVGLDVVLGDHEDTSVGIIW
jgi:hypothetical protein